MKPDRHEPRDFRMAPGRMPVDEVRELRRARGAGLAVLATIVLIVIFVFVRWG